MKKFKANIINSFVLILVGATLLTACSLGVALTLRAPIIDHEEEIKSVSWYQNEKAESFDVYINNSKVENILQDDNTSVYTFNYSSYVVEDGSYTIKVKAIGDGENYKDSRFSNSVVIYVGENVTGGYDTSALSIVRDSDLSPDNVEYVSEGKSIRWDNVEKNGEFAERYIVQIYCNEYTEDTDNSDKIRSFYVSQNYFVLTDYLKGNEVLAISIGSKFADDENIYVSDVYYHNPLNMGQYSNVYVFDGGVYDYYIEDYEELQNLYYYSYISRNTSLEFMVEKGFYSSHTNDYFNMNQYQFGEYLPFVHQKYIIALNENYQKYLLGINDCYDKWAYYETYDFSMSPYLQLTSDENSNGPIFTLRTGYSYTQPELNTSGGKTTGLSEKILSQTSLETPYYDKVDYTPRDEDYDDFHSDKNVLTTYCTSSEELYWAVENNVTPLFNSSNSRAYLVYQEAKNVLIDIISDEMSEYEKVLCIFDWIATNTCYDNDGFASGATTNNSCYYLEGVFLDDNRIAVCDGFSKAFSLLCNMEGIDCYRVMGMAGSGSLGGHAWNKVAVNGNWYVVDITWTEIKQSEVETDENGDIEYNVDSVGGKYYKEPKLAQSEEYNSHRYFLVSDNYISDTHVPFAQREKVSDANLPANKMYGYYTNTSFVYKGNTYSRVIDENSDMEAVLNYIYQNNIQNFEVVFDYNYINSWGYDFSSAIQEGRGNNLFMGVSIVGYLNQYDDALYALETPEKIYDKEDKTYYTCEYEAVVIKSGISAVYYTESKAGYVLYLSCETNIINVNESNLSDDNRYTQFISYLVDNALEFDRKIAFEDAFLSDIIGLDLSTVTFEQISSALSEYLIRDINAYAGSDLYKITSFTFDKTEDVISAVFNGSEFEEKEYVSYVFDAKIEFDI